MALVNRLDILRREEAHVSMATTPPAQRIGAVNEFDDVTTQEAQLRGVVGGEVEEGVCMVGTLWRKRWRENKKVNMSKSHFLKFYFWSCRKLQQFSLHLYTRISQSTQTHTQSARFLFSWTKTN